MLTNSSNATATCEDVSPATLVQNSPRARVIIVDDHPMVRMGIRRLLERECNLKIVGEAGTYHDALTMVKELAPNLVLVDLTLEEGSGLDLVKQLRHAYP